MRIGLLSCTKQKQGYPCKASIMYSASPRFALAYMYAKRTCDRIYILSAKYGLIHEDTVIEPYNTTLKDQSDSERRNWADKVLTDLGQLHSLTDNEYIIIAGMNYCEHLLPRLRNYKRPLQGVPLGSWIPALKALIKKFDQQTENHSQNPSLDGNCDHLHDLFSHLKRYSWSEIDQIPFNDGIYIVFERGEVYKGWDRITRIGTHVADGNLKQRLRNHFMVENKDASVFRKNIGQALLNKVHDPYLKAWGLDTSKPKVQADNASLIDTRKQASIECQVTEFLRAQITFTCIPVTQSDDRLRYEEAIISTLAHASGFHSSQNWLGRHNPKEPIIRSGLWNYLGLDAPQMSGTEMAEIDRRAGVGDLSAGKVYSSESRMGWATESGRPGNEYRSVTPRKQLSLIQDDDSPVDAVQIRLIDSPDTFEKSGTYPANRVDRQPVLDRSTDQPVRRAASTSEIRDHIRMKIEAAQKKGHDHIDLVSGSIHRELGLSNCMPSVCSAMRQVMGRNDSILRTTPSGNSSTIMIRYWTN